MTDTRDRIWSPDLLVDEPNTRQDRAADLAARMALRQGLCRRADL